MSNLINGYVKVAFPESRREYVYLVPSYITVEELIKNNVTWVVVPNGIPGKSDTHPYSMGKLIEVQKKPYEDSKIKPNTFICEYINNQKISNFNSALRAKKKFTERVEKCYEGIDDIFCQLGETDNTFIQEATLKAFELFVEKMKGELLE